MIDRRTLLMGPAALALTGMRVSAAPGHDLFTGPEIPFSFGGLTSMARDLSQRPFQKPGSMIPSFWSSLILTPIKSFRFRPDAAIWSHGDGPYPIELFHAGRYFKEPVRIYIVSARGVAREVRYSPDLFTYGRSTFAKALPADTGFAGFRVLTAPGMPDWLAFLGASYFRSPAETGQYGLSSRGLAIDVAMPTPEEFPRFTSFCSNLLQANAASPSTLFSICRARPGPFV